LRCSERKETIIEPTKRSLGGCTEKAQSLVGIYIPDQAACDPGATHGAGWLQTQLLGIGLLERVEYLEAIAEEGRCQVAVYNAIDRMPTGLICIETEGSLYCLTPGVDGRLHASDPWQLDVDGTWGPINFRRLPSPKVKSSR